VWRLISNGCRKEPIGLLLKEARVGIYVSLAYLLVALIPTRRVSEGFCGIVRPSLTLRVVMFHLPAANRLNQQAVTLRVGIGSLPRGKSAISTTRNADG
jgi:hypothetical protein